jgi:PAS domain-containing protein
MSNNKTAIFTDENGRVVLRHRQPESLSDIRRAEAALITNTADIPEPPALEENYVAIMYVRNGAIEYESEYREPVNPDEQV